MKHVTLLWNQNRCLRMSVRDFVATNLFFKSCKLLEEAMAAMLAHCGPHDLGCYERKNIALGHRRLSSTGIHEGHQPLSNENSQLWIVFNGVI